MNSLYDRNTVTATNAQFWFHPFHPGNFDVKDVARSRSPIVANVDKIMDIFALDRHVSSISITQELNIYRAKKNCLEPFE